MIKLVCVCERERERERKRGRVCVRENAARSFLRDKQCLIVRGVSAVWDYVSCVTDLSKGCTTGVLYVVMEDITAAPRSGSRLTTLVHLDVVMTAAS